MCFYRDILYQLDLVDFATTKKKRKDLDQLCDRVSKLITEIEESLAEEQQALDDNDDIVSELNIRIQRLVTLATPPVGTDTKKMVTKQLTLLTSNLKSIEMSINALEDNEDGLCALEEHRDQVVEIKKELSGVKTSLLKSDTTTEDPVMQDHTRTEQIAFECLLSIKKRLRSHTSSKTASSEATTTKLPKLELPTFYGDILRWKNFWEQFCVSVHERSSIPKEEKLMYLQSAIKDRTAKNLIAGLTKSSDHYDEAIKCLQERYDRPRQIHQAHVRRIVEVASLKDGTGREIRALHNVVVQHIRALKSLGHEPPGSFITSKARPDNHVRVAEAQSGVPRCPRLSSTPRLLESPGSGS